MLFTYQNVRRTPCVLQDRVIGAATLYPSISFHFCIFWAQKQIVSFLDIALNHFPVYPSIRFAKSRFSLWPLGLCRVLTIRECFSLHRSNNAMVIKSHGVCMKTYISSLMTARVSVLSGVLAGFIILCSGAVLFSASAQAQQPPSLMESLAAPPAAAELASPNPASPPPIGDAGPAPFAAGAEDPTAFEDPNAKPKLTEEEAELEMRRKAFKASISAAMPLKPNEIRRLLEAYDETQQATETPIYPDPEPISSFTRTSLDPGAVPVVIKTAVGSVTTVSIVDISGQPWPIQDLTWAGSFQVEQPEAGSHMLRITPTAKFATGNISLRLVGLNPPVIFSLRTERKSVHVRLDVQIPEMGPRGVIPVVDTPLGTKAGNDMMTAVLLGVISTNSGTERLKVDGIDGRTSAFSQGGMVYVRTPYTLLSPAWSQSVQSADGTKVYAMGYTPVIILSDKGKMVRAYLSHKEQSDGE